MTEQEYIDATDLQKVRMIKDILMDITVENQLCINKDDFKIVYAFVTRWENSLVEVVSVTS